MILLIIAWIIMHLIVLLGHRSSYLHRKPPALVEITQAFRVKSVRTENLLPSGFYEKLLRCLWSFVSLSIIRDW